ncbi:FxsB family cyclophane-forming radical SAM/SPASM peptide maturase [Microbispora sp. H13382]|uniref:FxsB family cyclophane-forming radical SAM/SPASM peptide maturase n=1 Tax=Microbispora sp. H13382 TaxID=2729112 RepID=UPI001C71DF2D|nr:FxsB family cyclophane-forming radical SAM/SPASM peptide maturase [Microbispora sp. H13382]
MVTEYVLKIHNRCDLACDHCYVYEHADQSWRRKPRAIGGATVRWAARRIAEHAAAHGLGEIRVVLHGGEPLLLGAAGLREVLAVLRSRVDPVCRLDLRLHTNGVLLDETLCALFDEYAVRVGVSLDGDRAANDRHRRFADGRSSHPHVRHALELLRRPEYRHLYAGLLCTVDPANDPIAVYEALLAESPPSLDLLLPHATWDHPPPRPGGGTPYADWLGRVHARWTSDGRPVAIRLFDSMLSAASGGPSLGESVGLDPVNLLVIETDGGWEQADSLKTAFDGAPETGLNVRTHAVDAVAALPGPAARRGGLAALCETCRSCEVVRVCGGGLYAHRYRTGSGFSNPSVYCPDLKALAGLVVPAAKAAPAPDAGSTGTAAHTLSPAAFDSLARGPGDPAAVAALAQAGLSLTRALVARVASGLPDGAGELEQAAWEGLALLSRVDLERPAAVAEVLAHPCTAVWASRCLRPPRAARATLDLAHLAGIAASAALHAGMEAELPLPVRDGSLHLPALGVLRLGRQAGRTIRVSVSSRGLYAAGRRVTGQDPRWLPVRSARFGDRTVLVDDLDAFRGRSGWRPAGRLTGSRWEGWRTCLDGAGKRLEQDAPAYARALRAGLRAVVPLRPGPPRGHRAGGLRHPLGAVGLPPPGSGDLEVALLREFQIAKLDALTTLHGLVEVTPQAPGRILREAYARLAQAELWRVTPGADARDRFGRLSARIHEAIDVLTASGSLTPHGVRFVAGMRATVGSWAGD